MSEPQIVPAAGGVGLRLDRGELLRITDIEGGQTGDLVALSRDGSERLSNGRTFDYGGKIYVSAGDVLWSDRSNPMLTILADEVGKHDFLYAACSLEMYRIQYKVTGHHPNCHDNLCAGLRELGIKPEPLPTPLNLFMNVDVAADGRLLFAPPRSRAGAAIVLRAEMDLAIGLSACPAATCNGGAPARPLGYQILSGA
ncbi:MAG TPA: urea carboxylase-associated family protein [Bosea sp. (in: a-proteobacteria)]|nr:urea carboxylase-associated family protein [Bosea sp. (in: a-proteobacteria)]